jgi:hypothetical protein
MVGAPTVPDSLLEINAEIHRSLSYQSTENAENLTGSSEQTLAAGKGHCGDFVYLLANALAGTGRKVVVWDASSVDNLIRHKVVDVDGAYTLDPTLGIAYPNSFLDLVKNPSLAGDQAESVNSNLVLYAGANFFAALSNFCARSWRGSAHGIPLHLSAKVSVEEGRFHSGTETFLSDGSSLTVAGAAPGRVRLKYSWQHRVAGSYVSILPDWGSMTLPTQVRVVPYLDGREVRNYKQPLEQRFGALSFWLSDTFHLDSLQLLFDEFSGQQRRLIVREIGIFGHTD